MQAKDVINNSSKQKLYYYLTVLTGTLLLMIPAFYNGYPLVNPDAGTYIASGFKLETPADRPITYGLLIRLLSGNGFSLWPVIFAQSYVLTWLVAKLTKAILQVQYTLPAILIFLCLSLCTGLPWIVSQLQPDIFTPIAVLCIVLLLINRISRAGRILLYVLFFIAIAVHLSHLLLFFLMLIVFFCYTIWLPSFKKIVVGKRKLLILLVLTLASIGIMGSALSKSKHLFFMGAMLQQGILKKYLDDKCPTRHYTLCTYKDSLPANSDLFIWDSNSPVYKMGGWKATKPDFDSIINGTLTDPKYISLHIKASLISTLQQLYTFHTGEGNFQFKTGSNVYERIADNIPRELPTFNKDKQNTTDIIEIFQRTNGYLNIIMLLSVCGLVLLIVSRWRRVGRELKILIVASITCVILNAWDCGTFSEVLGRYGCKVMWLLPLCFILFIIEIARHRRIY